MATKKGTKANGTTTKPAKEKSTLDLATPDLFGELAQSIVPVDFGDIHPTVLHNIIGRICKLGGYIAFSAPTGGMAVKLTVSVGGSTGQRWLHDGHELSAHIAHLNNLLRKLEGE